MIDMDYVLLIGALAVGAFSAILTMSLIYRRGIAIHLSVVVVGCIVFVAMITFFLGKEGITLIRCGIALVIGTPPVIFSLVLLAKKIITPARQVAAIAVSIAEGNLEQQIEIKSNDEFGDMARALNTMITQFKEIVTQVKATADNVVSSSQRMSSSAQEMSQGAAAQAAGAEEASASIQQMAANIHQNADNALQTEKIALKSAEDARESGQTVAETVDAMHKIMKKISIVEDLARQTRMLSLNATIEAAKAHEHGRGFAVVAAEVRSLAERSQAAAEEITELASSSGAIAEKAGEMVKKLVPDIQKTAELVQEISAASTEQNTGAQQINRAIQQLDQVTQQNSATSEEMAATAEELAAQAVQLQHTLAFFQLEKADQETAILP